MRVSCGACSTAAIIFRHCMHIDCSILCGSVETCVRADITWVSRLCSEHYDHTCDLCPVVDSSPHDVSYTMYEGVSSPSRMS